MTSPSCLPAGLTDLRQVCFFNFSLHAQLETLPGTLCARKFQSLFLVVCVTGQLVALHQFADFLFWSKKNAATRPSEAAVTLRPANSTLHGVGVTFPPPARPLSPIGAPCGREGAAASQPTSHPGCPAVTHGEGTAAVLPHADAASVCLVCRLTSSALPVAHSGCDSGGWHGPSGGCQSNVAFRLR